MNTRINTMKYRLMSLLRATICIAALPIQAWSQDESFKNISQQFETFNRRSAREKLYLHTDKSFYLAGEIVWFKVYYVDAASHGEAGLSKTAYVEVIDRTGKPVAQAKIALSKKGGGGSFYLPLTLSSDNYLLRAYTNWMKNEGGTAFFEKTISIVNTIKPVEKRNQPDSIRVMTKFFPEGGNLVNGIETKLAFHIVDQNGKGIDAAGIVTDNNGDTVGNFSPQRFGIGNFSFKPVEGRTYKATVVLPDGNSFASSLPTAYGFGYVMNVTDNKDGRLKVRIQARAKEPGQRGERVYLLAHTRQATKVTEPGFINYESDLVIYIDKSKLGEGVSHLTLFNKDQQPVCERLVFKKPSAVQAASIRTDKDMYGQRQKVNLSIADGNSGAGGNYSVAVFQSDSLQDLDGDNIASYLWLSSDLRGNVESPAFYFSAQPGIDEAVDNLLLTHGWRRFRWENVLAKSQPAPIHLPEYDGHLVTVKVTNQADGSPAVGVKCFLSYPTSPFGISVARTNSKGIAYFNAKKYYGPGDIIAQTSNESNGNYRVDVLTPFSEEKMFTQLSWLNLEKKEELKLTGKSISMQAQNVYTVDSIRRFNSPSLSDTFPFFGKSEYIYRLDEYKRFTTMEEVLREYVTPINVVLRNGKLYMSIYDEMTQTIYNDQMLVLLDGVPLMDYNKIFSYDPLKVKKLEVVPRRFMLGGMNFKGIASFETYSGKFDGFELIPGLVAVDYEGLQLQREFYSPSYDNISERSKRIPDLRSTLYWIPETPSDEAGNTSLQFYTSDLQGKYMVVLQGFNSKGEPVSVTHSFSVK